MRFEPADTTLPEVRDLLADHLREVGCHALDPDAPAAHGVTLWTVWDDDRLLGCGALREITRLHGEITTMHTVPDARGQGVGSAVLAHLLYQARRRGHLRVSVATGAQDVFAPAHRLYLRNGFQACPPFGDHTVDPNSVFMTLSL